MVYFGGKVDMLNIRKVKMEDLPELVVIEHLCFQKKKRLQKKRSKSAFN